MHRGVQIPHQWSQQPLIRNKTKLTEIYARWSSILTELPTSGELKSGDPLFSTTTLPPPPRKFNEPYHSSPPLINMGMIEDIMWSLTWSTNYHNLWYHFDARNNLCHDQWLNRCKNAPETVLRIRKFKFWAKNGLNLKLGHRKAQKMILSGTYGDLYGRLGD